MSKVHIFGAFDFTQKKYVATLQHFYTYTRIGKVSRVVSN